MSYEVLKTIGGRQYRYRVQSERDATTGKTRNRWTYVGRVTEDGEIRPPRGGRTNARLRLLEGCERLLAAGDAAAVTVSAIAAEAGVAHGTFYRYFKDRSEALEALARHIRATRGTGDDRQLRDDVDSPGAARAGIRTWVDEKLRFAREHRSIYRAWHALIASESRLAAYREEAREQTLARLRDHITALARRGWVDVADPAATAASLVALIDGTCRAAVLERDCLDDARILATADLAERALFVDGRCARCR
jgi:AcrR family transcriptional regulator